MILDKFKIEFQGEMSEKNKQDLKEKLISFSESVKAVCINIIGDETLIISETVDICRVILEYLADDTPVNFGVYVNKNFNKGQREVVITLSDSEEDLKSINTSEQIINL